MNKSGSKPRVGVFIIAYNAVNHLIATINRIPDEIFKEVEEIFVIDDASSDNSYYAALGYKYEHKIDKLTVHRNEKNQGYGGNQKVGYRYAIERGFDVVALVHGDGQYAPEALPYLLEPFYNGEADMVFGSRMSERGAALKGGMPVYKYIGNRILTFIQNRLTGLDLSEYHSGYRLYSTEALRNIPFESFTNSWHFDTQIILALAERGYRIVERPIPTYYGDEICHVNGIPYAMHCLITTWQYYRNRRNNIISYPGPMDVPRLNREQDTTI
ncbi:MAG: glycosyltransferase family 2 protein [Candidatus Dadabacteria bacterium]|nr:MAG: glycosyltransferase family 2 protein [Candidatus Dadabacteria bacterium]